MAERIVTDTWRAVLVVGCFIAMREVSREAPVAVTQAAVAGAAAPQQATYAAHVPQTWAPQYQPPPPEYGNQKPLRKIGEAFVELGDSVIGAIRR